jgi:hypothetical protein
MRDFGPPRNVIYNFPAQSEHKTDTDSVNEYDALSTFSTP